MFIQFNDDKTEDVKIKTDIKALKVIKKAEMDSKKLTHLNEFKLAVSYTDVMAKVMREFHICSEDIDRAMAIQNDRENYKKSGDCDPKVLSEVDAITLMLASEKEKAFDEMFDNFWVNGEEIVNECLRALTGTEFDFYNEVTFESQKEVIRHFLFPFEIELQESMITEERATPKS